MKTTGFRAYLRRSSMKLSEMFDHAPEIEISELCFDSRIKTKNSLFFCISGINSDGHDFVDQAIANGAVCIVHSKPIENKQKGIVYVKDVPTGQYIL